MIRLTLCDPFDLLFVRRNLSLHANVDIFHTGEGAQLLSLDLLAVHMIRKFDTSNMFFYHPPGIPKSAERFHSRVRLAGESVYWQKIFRKSKDPTFVLLASLSYAIYSWDQALEALYKYISQLVSATLPFCADFDPL